MHCSESLQDNPLGDGKYYHYGGFPWNPTIGNSRSNTTCATALDLGKSQLPYQHNVGGNDYYEEDEIDSSGDSTPSHMRNNEVLNLSMEILRNGPPPLRY